MLKRIKFLANVVVALDGIHSIAISKGDVREVPSNIADAMTSDGRAEEVGAETVGYETKDTTTEEKKKESKPAKKKAKKKKG